MKWLTRFAYAALGLIVGVSGVLVTQVVSAVKTPVKTPATLTYRDIRVNINGAETTLTDLEGNRQEPFIAFDTVYVPLSATARALGKVSVWDSENAVINMRDMKAEGGTPVQLSTFAHSSSAGDKFQNLGDVKLTDNSYAFDVVGIHSVYSFNWKMSGSRDYALNGRYNRIEGDAVMINYGRNDYSTIQIWGDQKLLYEKKLQGDANPVHFSVDLIGVSTLKIDITGDFISAGLSNGALYRN